ncbi:MAG: T9SS type A sorting domain-containing protein, partial [Candidatus Cloacimonetes bacterium]|nr:T9SS type A sorting domain-containing protein [Candidatus Cloacimonadota bacterium]
PPYSFDPPINLTAHTDEHGVYLLWQPPENRRNYAYNIFRDDEFLKRNADTTYIDTDVQSYTTYHYYVTSVYEQGYSPPSEVIEITTDSIMSVDNLPYSDTSEIYLKCFPNPFSTSTTISFNLATKSHKKARINIYNIKGELIKQLSIIPDKCRDQLSIVWYGKDENGRKVPSGIYLCKLSIGKYKIVRKMVLLR